MGRGPVTAPRHWDEVYSSKAPDELSWFQREPSTSLRLLTAYGRPTEPVVDVGAGESPLGERLLDRGFHDVTLLDVSEAALAAVRRHLGERVSYVAADVRVWRPTRTYGAWHDRAVFHFLTEEDDQERYVEAATAAVESGGVAVLGVFAEDGPTSCSGLPTTRWSAEHLGHRFGDHFGLVHQEREEHLTPWGAVQPFTWVVLRRA